MTVRIAHGELTRVPKRLEHNANGLDAIVFNPGHFSVTIPIDQIKKNELGIFIAELW